MDDAIESLLALRRRSATRAARLATALWERPLTEVLEDPVWAPRSSDWRAARRALRVIRILGIEVFPIWKLPRCFSTVQPKPVVVFVRGDSKLLNAAAIGIVGSRAATPDAKRWAFTRAMEAAHQGCVVTSGGAVGVDGAAHRGALTGGGKTVVYLGVAADRIYPSRHRELFGRILEKGGALVSEHPPGMATFKGAHALRNRFIAAHGRELLVVEADEGSGSLGTARFARRFGRQVWVSPPTVGKRRDGLDWLVRNEMAQIWG